MIISCPHCHEPIDAVIENCCGMPVHCPNCGGESPNPAGEIAESERSADEFFQRMADTMREDEEMKAGQDGTLFAKEHREDNEQ